MTSLPGGKAMGERGGEGRGGGGEGKWTDESGGLPLGKPHTTLAFSIGREIFISVKFMPSS